MKFLAAFFVMVISVTTQAAQITDGRFNSKTNSIDLDVAYSGGCEIHEFTLEIGSCQESDPVQCPNVQLIEDSHGDNCKAYIQETISIALSTAGLDGRYFEGALLTIHGEGNSSVAVTLPK